MSDIVKEMLGKFIDLSREEKQIAAEMEAAYKEYNDYCADSEKDLNKKIDEIHEKMAKLDHFIEYAREHADPSGLEDAAEPFDTSEGTLESIRQTIKLDSHDDPNAETLYTKATGKKLYYEQEIERTRQLIEGSKVQAKRQYDSDTAKLNKRKEEHFEKVSGYVQSQDFSDYLKLLVYDKSAFNSPGTVTLNDDEHISLGQRRVKLSLPMEIEQDVALNSNGEYNAASRTIGAPLQVSAKKGSVLFLEHDERNGQYLLGGIQRLLLNFIKYFGEDITSVLFCEPDRFSADSLGNISALGMGIDPFITVPKSMDEVEGRVMRFAAKAESASTPDKVSRILVLLDLPEKYSFDMAQKVLEMCKNAEKTGTLIIITHQIPSEVTPIEAEIRQLAEVIRSRNGGFWIESTHESLFWYSAPSDISDEVRRVYVEKRRQDALKAAQEPTTPTFAEEAPKPAPAPAEEPKPAEPIYTAPAPMEEQEPMEEPVYTAPAPTEEPKPAPALTPRYSAPADEPYTLKPVREAKPIEPAPMEELEPMEEPVDTAPAPVEEPKPAEPAYTAPAPMEESEQVEEPAYTAPAPKEEPKPAPALTPRYSAPADEPYTLRPAHEAKPVQPVQQAEPTAPVEEPKPAEPAYTAPAPMEEPEPMEQPAYTASAPAEEPGSSVPSYGDENLDHLSVSEDGKPIPAHILFSIPRPKPEEKEVTMTVMSELSDQLPPPEEEIDPFQAYDFRPDFRPEQKLDPEYTYRITDHPQAMASASASASDTDPAPAPAAEPTEKRNPIKGVLDAGKGVLDAGKGVFDAGRRKIGEFVDNRKSDSSAKRVTGVNYSAFDMSEPVADNTPAVEPEAPPATQMSFDVSLDAPVDAPMNAYQEAPAETIGNTVEEMIEEPIVETVPEPVVEDTYEKGTRKLPLIPIGKTVEDVPVNMDINGNISYICGNRGEERKKLTSRIISQIIASTHPDDVELWLFDCGDGEFMKYADDPAEHIKYLISDVGAETSLDFADVIASELERRVKAFADNNWSGVDDIPADVFMPLIVVAVNAFSKFHENIVKTPKYFGRNYTNKLAKMFKSCSNYGIRFLLIGDEFSDNGERPNCFDGCTIHSAAVVAGQDHAAHELFSDLKLYDNEIESLRKIPSGCAFTADENSTDGLTLVRITGDNAKNENTYKMVSEYSEDLEVFLDKHPFIGDRKAASLFDDRREYRAEQIKNRTEDECLLFLGEPCRFMGEYPVRLYDDFGENLLAIAPAREKSSAALMVRAALRSLEEQGIKTEVLAYRSNPVYAELMQCEELANIKVYEGAKADDRIKAVVDMLDKGERPGVFEIVLGGDLLVASMHADDTLAVLKRALVKGPRVGTHFMFVSGSVAQAATGFLSLFRHKLVFACPYSEAEKILRDPNCDLLENSFRLSNDYDELTILPYSM